MPHYVVPDLCLHCLPIFYWFPGKNGLSKNVSFSLNGDIWPEWNFFLLELGNKGTFWYWE